MGNGKGINFSKVKEEYLAPTAFMLDNYQKFEVRKRKNDFEKREHFIGNMAFRFSLRIRQNSLHEWIRVSGKFFERAKVRMGYYVHYEQKSG